MNHCKYCAENDESRLILSSRFINGRVIQEWICTNCSWRDEFVHEAKGENGNSLSESVEEGIFTQSDFHKLLERFDSGGEG